jgi:hypothetical protein
MARGGTTALALAAALTLAVAAACGGGSARLSKSQYEQKLQAQGSVLGTSFARIGSAINRGDLKDLARQIGRTQGQLEHAADEIGDLKPPKNVESANRKIADTLDKFAGILGRLKTAAQSGDLTRVQQLVQQIQRVGKAGQDAARELQRKGYKVGVFGQTR